ncbi:MAG: SPOR domain-containing protein [Trueperaceae bacterium]
MPLRATSWVAVLLLAWVASAAWAEGYSVQTVAVRDLRLATSVAEDLQRNGYDAYTEFAMFRGAQWTRVRVGCFRDEAIAIAFAWILRDAGHQDAAVVERTPGAPTRGCVVRDVGFVTPDAWTQPVAGVPTFRVEVAEVSGLLRYDGRRWQLLQAPAEDALAPREVASGRFREANGTSTPFVVVEHHEGPTLLCPGRLLASLENAVVVQHDDVVAACRLDEDDPLSAEGA